MQGWRRSDHMVTGGEPRFNGAAAGAVARRGEATEREERNGDHGKTHRDRVNAMEHSERGGGVGIAGDLPRRPAAVKKGNAKLRGFKLSFLPRALGVVETTMAELLGSSNLRGRASVAGNGGSYGC